MWDLCQILPNKRQPSQTYYIGSFFFLLKGNPEEFRWFHNEGRKPSNVRFVTKILAESCQSQNFRAFCSVHGRKKPYECEICIKFFFLKGKLNRHIAFIHDGKKPYKCEVCDKFFLLIDNLVRHIISVHFFSSKSQPKRIQVISPWREEA